MPVMPWVEAMLTMTPGRFARDAVPAEQLRQEERALEVGVDHVVPFGIGDVDHGPAAARGRRC